MYLFLDASAISWLIAAAIFIQRIPAVAQEQTPTAPPAQAQAGVESERPALPGYGQLHRDFGFPGAVRVWERGMYLNPQPHRAYGLIATYPRFGGFGAYFGSRPAFSNRLYRESYDGGYQAYSLRLDHAYDLGVAPAEIQAPLANQAARALIEFQNVMQAGHEAFTRGDYSDAARHFLLATELNQGDPGSRLCAAHAEVALGHYEHAAALVHRAFDLQPKLVYLSPDIRDAYGDMEDFDAHVEGLRRVTEDSRSALLWFLLGYYCHSYGALREAADALARAHRLDPADHVIARFAAATGH
jgi:hypothetical protein